MLRAWRRWRNNTNLSDGTFLKLYMWDRILIRPKRRLRRWLRK
ncbi:hypothetical protein ACR77J_16475 [Tissierella praeacuta]